MPMKENEDQKADARVDSCKIKKTGFSHSEGGEGGVIKGGGWGKLWGEGGSGKKGKMGGREGVVVEIRGNIGMWGIVGKDSLSTLRFRCLFIYF